MSPRSPERKSAGQAAVSSTLIAGIMVVVAASSSVLAQQVKSGAELPEIESCPCRTGIAGMLFSAPAPALRAGMPVTWQLVECPAGMVIDTDTGETTWAGPTEGQHRVRVVAFNQAGEDRADWLLTVVANDFPDPVIVSSRYADFVMPASFAAYWEERRPHDFFDACWEHLRDLVGQEPRNGRQVIRYDPNGGFGAHSGNPVEIGVGFWDTDAYLGWGVAASIGVHEVIHNFHGEISAPGYGDWPWVDQFVHHLCELSHRSTLLQAENDPAAFGLEGVRLDQFRAWSQWGREDVLRRYGYYEDFLALGGRAVDYTDGTHDPYGAWAGICLHLSDQFGAVVLEKALRAYRPDGLPAGLRAQADTIERRLTLFLCVFSAAAGQDLRPMFDDWGFDVDPVFYDAVLPEVTATIEALPDIDRDGWKYCTVRERWTRLTRFRVPWTEARRQALRWGGNLAVVPDALTDQWLLQAFNWQGEMGIGLTDEASEGSWTWVTGGQANWFNWGAIEPNGGLNENYVAINWYGGRKWNDCDDLALLLGIVEREHADGYLRVRILPESAAGAGARWRRVGQSTWHESGEVEPDIPSGVQAVEFLAGNGWANPEPITVRVRIAEIEEAEATYMSDADSDGLTDERELILGTNPYEWDTDHDGLSDYQETYWDGDPALNPFNSDSNPTGSDTDPLVADTDGDGVNDGQEATFGYDPLDDLSTPQLPAVSCLIHGTLGLILLVAGTKRLKHRT